MGNDIIPVVQRNSDKRKYKLTERLTTIGAAPQSRIVLNGDEYPPHIAHIIYAEGNWRFSVLSKHPKVLCNAKPVAEPVTLSDGDTLAIGHEIFSFTTGMSSCTDGNTGTVLSPLRRFIAALSRFSRTGDSDVRFELLAGIAQLLGADGARLVTGERKGAFSTIARYPRSSGLDRFSERAIVWAKEQGTTVLMHDTDWESSRESKGSLELNKVGSVLCSPLSEGDLTCGFLYLDRHMEKTPFTDDDRQVLDDVGPIFGDLLMLYNRAGRQRETIERLQESIEQTETPIIFECDAMRQAIEWTTKFAETDSPVLITGETGTGKELFARFIHRHSNRKNSDFCAINCGALPENLIESELFGHEKGAFTGAHQQKEGLFKRAHGGTVFLDEIGEMPLALQVKLLRVLQEGEMTPVGATAVQKVDIRIVAATNRDLQEEVRLGTFREDLYYRLNVLHVSVPALRDRHRDVLLLTDYFIHKYAVRFGINEKSLSLQAQALLLKYEWPGNIRQLENSIQKALLTSRGTLITDNDLDLPDAAGVSDPKGTVPENDEGTLTLKEARMVAEINCIQRALHRAEGNVSIAARLLDTDRKWLTKLMKQHGIEKK
jgi:two-component system, NtrC family, response regulator AtoC